MKPAASATARTGPRPLRGGPRPRASRDDASAVARRLLTYTAHDDSVLADEPVRAFVRAATGTAEVSGRRARDLVRKAAYELVVAPRDLEAHLWRHTSETP